MMAFAVGARSFGAEPPVSVVQELQNRGCRVSNKKPKDIIRGEFLKPGQSDWAALCSTKKTTSLLVFPGGSTEGIAVLETNSKGFSIMVDQRERAGRTEILRPNCAMERLAVRRNQPPGHQVVRRVR
jgi:hypothetical protein